jgi:apolipoprotein N-acyltransferase
MHPETRLLALKLARFWRTPLLLGMNSCVADDPEHMRCYNSAVLIADGLPLGRYDKVHRVPFGEYVPVRNWLPWLSAVAPYDFDYSVHPGEQFTHFPLAAAAGDFSFGVVICYEDTVPEMANPYVRDPQSAVNFLINISNDGWFDGTSEHDEHLAICRFRAVECRRSVARAVNMGISAVVDSNGRVLRPERDGEENVWRVRAENGRAPALPVSEWHKFKKVQGVLLAAVPIDGRTSLCARWGNWLPWSCWGLVAVGLVAARLRRRAAPSPGGA